MERSIIALFSGWEKPSLSSSPSHSHPPTCKRGNKRMGLVPRRRRRRNCRRRQKSHLAEPCRTLPGGVVEPIDDCCSYKIEKERDQTWECWPSFVL